MSIRRSAYTAVQTSCDVGPSGSNRRIPGIPGDPEYHPGGIETGRTLVFIAYNTVGRVGFEPTRRVSAMDLQSTPFNHSGTDRGAWSVRRESNPQRRTPPVLQTGCPSNGRPTEKRKRHKAIIVVIIHGPSPFSVWNLLLPKSKGLVKRFADGGIRTPKISTVSG